MFKRLFIMLMLLSPTIAFGFGFHIPTGLKPVPSVIQAHILSEDAALKRGDAKGAVAYDTVDYREYDIKDNPGVGSKQEDFNRAVNTIKSSEYRTVKTQFIGATLSGSQVTVYIHKDGILLLKQGATKRKIGYHVDQKQFWLHQNGRWLESEKFDLRASVGDILTPNGQ